MIMETIMARTSFFVFSHIVCIVTLNNDVYDIIHKYVNKNLNVNLGAT